MNPGANIQVTRHEPVDDSFAPISADTPTGRTFVNPSMPTDRLVSLSDLYSYTCLNVPLKFIRSHSGFIVDIKLE